ncbi:NAD(P)/FAD-dependent oxidoreductase [Streptomyces triticirhizae]|uniref:FAD-binding protein n=1 Tax=Streptomyces triticirhizae TaxID=2483353 RepID=A0A3M2LMD4_9ACTN|nr:FAD-dependent oxidoreductase [Streptomyces triticirhizae]RMI38276.1 FAD-binding protein [Streptomyces triticirhizae]
MSTTEPTGATEAPTPRRETVDVLIVGGGPAGLTAAARLAPRVAGRVLVLDREADAGGIPRHSDHPGYGLRDLRRMMSGPAYARTLVARAAEAGAEIRTRAMVTGWSDERTVEVTSPDGRYEIAAGAVVLATGARERPRTARRVPGDRPQGVLTTGQLQNIVHMHHGTVGERAVVVGGELVSWSAVLTLREAGCRTALMVSRYPKVESYAAFTVPGRTVLGVPVATRARVTRIIGKGRVSAVEIEHLDTGRRRTVACDTVVFTGDWIPDHELVRSAGIDLDPHTLGPRVDPGLRTSRPGVFAVGNLLHPVDTADIAALDGAHVTEQVLRWLAADGRPTTGEGVPILAEAPLRWIAPSVLRPDSPAPARNRLLLWTDAFVRVPRVTVRQDGRVVARRTLPWPAAPGRVLRIPSSVLRDVDPHGGPVRVSVR